jgi:hypothetical protein
VSSCLGWQEHPPGLTPGAKQSSKNQGIEEGNSQFSQGIADVASTAGFASLQEHLEAIRRYKQDIG